MLFDSFTTDFINKIHISDIKVEEGSAFYAGAIFLSSTVSLIESFIKDGKFRNIYSSRGAVIVDRHSLGNLEYENLVFESN